MSFYTKFVASDVNKGYVQLYEVAFMDANGNQIDPATLNVVAADTPYYPSTDPLGWITNGNYGDVMGWQGIAPYFIVESPVEVYEIQMSSSHSYYPVSWEVSTMESQTVPTKYDAGWIVKATIDTLTQTSLGNTSPTMPLINLIDVPRSVTVNSTTKVYDRLLQINSVTGVDELKSDRSNVPFKTMDYAYKFANLDESFAFYLQGVTDPITNYYQTQMRVEGRTLDVYGDKDATVLGKSDLSLFTSGDWQNTVVNFYNIQIRPYVYAAGASNVTFNHFNCFVRIDGGYVGYYNASCVANFFNCLYDGRGTSYHQRYGDSPMNFYGCVAFGNFYDGIAGLHRTKDTWINDSYYEDTTAAINNNNDPAGDYDSNYDLTSGYAANPAVGVKYGSYGWDGAVPNVTGDLWWVKDTSDNYYSVDGDGGTTHIGQGLSFDQLTYVAGSVSPVILPTTLNVIGAQFTIEHYDVDATDVSTKSLTQVTTPGAQYVAIDTLPITGDQVKADGFRLPGVVGDGEVYVLIEALSVGKAFNYAGTKFATSTMKTDLVERAESMHGSAPTTHRGFPLDVAQAFTADDLKSYFGSDYRDDEQYRIHIAMFPAFDGAMSFDSFGGNGLVIDTWEHVRDVRVDIEHYEDRVEVTPNVDTSLRIRYQDK